MYLSSPVRPHHHAPRKKTAERENDVPSSGLGEGELLDGSSKLSSMHAGTSTHTNNIRALRAPDSRKDRRQPGTWKAAAHRWHNKSLPGQRGLRFCHRSRARTAFEFVVGMGKAFRGNLLIRCHGDRTGHHIKSFTAFSPTSGRRLWLLLLALRLTGMTGRFFSVFRAGGN